LNLLVVVPQAGTEDTLQLLQVRKLSNKIHLMQEHASKNAHPIAWLWWAKLNQLRVLSKT